MHGRGLQVIVWAAVVAGSVLVGGTVGAQDDSSSDLPDPCTLVSASVLESTLDIVVSGEPVAFGAGLFSSCFLGEPPNRGIIVYVAGADAVMGAFDTPCAAAEAQASSYSKVKKAGKPACFFVAPPAVAAGTGADLYYAAGTVPSADDISYQLQLGAGLGEAYSESEAKAVLTKIARAAYKALK